LLLQLLSQWRLWLLLLQLQRWSRVLAYIILQALRPLLLLQPPRLRQDPRCGPAAALPCSQVWNRWCCGAHKETIACTLFMSQKSLSV
jgi:hypothetical protein